jgi:outer membrane immunogenic protein
LLQLCNSFQNLFLQKTIYTLLTPIERKEADFKMWGTIMRKLFCTTATAAVLVALSMTADAADVGAGGPTYVPPPVYAPSPFTWTGFYLGANIGGAWGQGTATDSLFGLSFGTNGVSIGGGQLGFNYQLGILLVGVEGDFDLLANTNNGVVVPGVGTIQVISENRWIATAAGRVGLTYDHWLFYGKAGGGWSGNNNLTFTNPATGATITASNNNSNSGWLAGAGIEWAFAPNLSAKIEYNYLRLNSRTFTVPAGSPFLAGDTFTTSNPNVQMVKVGLNYLFNGASSY